MAKDSLTGFEHKIRCASSRESITVDRPSTSTNQVRIGIHGPKGLQTVWLGDKELDEFGERLLLVWRNGDVQSN